MSFVKSDAVLTPVTTPDMPRLIAANIDSPATSGTRKTANVIRKPVTCQVIWSRAVTGWPLSADLKRTGASGDDRQHCGG